MNPFDEKATLKGRYICREDSFTVTVTHSKDSTAVTPDSPEGYSLTFSDKGVKTSFNGIEFSSDNAEISRFYPLFEMSRGINTDITKTTLTHSDGYIFKDFK